MQMQMIQKNLISYCYEQKYNRIRRINRYLTIEKDNSVADKIFQQKTKQKKNISKTTNKT